MILIFKRISIVNYSMLKDNLINAFNINNKFIGNIFYSKLVVQDIEIPNIQRIKDNDKIKDIVAFQLEHFKQKKYFNYMGTINIQYCKEDEIYYLIDGQHRFESLKQLYDNTGHDIEIVVELVYVDTIRELIDNYKLINENTPLPEFPESIDKNIPEKVSNYFQNKYPSMWSKNSRARRPHLYFNFFQEALGFLTEKLEIKDHTKLQYIIEEYNSKLQNWNVSQFQCSKDLNENMLQKCKESGLFLGLFKYTADDYYYKWVQSIIYNETGVIHKARHTNNKKTIPKSIKIDCWNQNIGMNIKNTMCICCCNKQIDTFNFHAGHIISEHNGGKTILENIIPICGACNLSMGTRNMQEFIIEYYPNNEKNFINRDYKQIIL